MHSTGRSLGQQFYRARYYDAGTGRFLSEDPLMFLTNTNFYPYASNRPTRFVDPLGLSEQDAQQILENYKKCVAELEASGERRRGSGTLNGWANNLISSFTLGHKYSGCTRQADLTASCLQFPSKPYDDKWTFEVISVEFGTHHITMAHSENPSDPIILLDPWRNTSATVPKGAGSGAGGGGDNVQ
jgi:RHS repeat-associated protein